MTETEILDEVLQREGGWRPELPRPNAPPDPATNFGITLPTLRAWRNNPTLTADDLKELRPEEARQIYSEEYIAKPGFTPENIPNAALRVQLIDFGINSGPATAVRWLQRCMGMVDEEVDGILGPQTVVLLHQFLFLRYDEEPYTRAANHVGNLLNDALVAARSYMIDRLEDTGKLRPQDEEGVESRALSFFLAKP